MTCPDHVFAENARPGKIPEPFPPTVKWITVKPTSQRCHETQGGGSERFPCKDPARDSDWWLLTGTSLWRVSWYPGNQLPFDQALVSSSAHMPGRILGAV